MKRTAVLIDDDELSRQDTRFRLKAIPNLVLAHAFAGVQEALVYFKRYPEQIDVIFCDIIMPDVDGFEANRLLDGRCRLFVFLSQKTQFDEELYSNATPVCFLRKPIDTNRVRALLAQLDERSGVLPETHELRDFVFFRENTTADTKRVFLNEILYINGHGRFIELVLEDKTKLTVDKSLHAVAMMLRDSKKFIRISNNCVVSIHGIDWVSKKLVVHLKDGQMRPVSRTYSKLFRDFMERNQ